MQIKPSTKHVGVTSFIKNTAQRGAGLYLEEATSLNVDTDVTTEGLLLIHENIANVYGGGIYSKSPLILPPSPEKYATNEIAKPVTTGKGPDIYVDGSLSFTFGCNKGKYFSRGSTPDFNQAADSATFCKACPIGYFNPSKYSFTCGHCSAGTYSDVIGLEECKSCLVGEYSSTSGQTSCKDCDAGQFTSFPGSITCVSCSVGMYRLETGGEKCTECPIDYFSTDVGRTTTCEKCPDDATTETKGQTVCLKCSAGFHMEIVEDGSKSCREW
jgi:hypothetical protein